MTGTDEAKPPQVVRDWLIARLAAVLQRAPAEISPSAPFAGLGIDSVRAVSLVGELSAWIGRKIDVTALFEFPSIEELVAHLASPGVHQLAAVGSGPIAIAGEPIAIVGLACRVPGANDPASFWRLLTDGVDAVSDVPAERWDRDRFHDPDRDVPGKAVTRAGGFLDRIDGFDPTCFGISPAEATRMDPQQRLLLELAWEALDDAGVVRPALRGTSAGVFVGISSNEYARLQLSDPTLIDSYAASSNALSIAANRISYFLDARGPSLAVDTACSSSLVAVHLAVRSLRGGECSVALAGGVNLMLSPALAISFSKAGVMAPDGRCKTFDAAANGYVRGEGAAFVVLKPLSRALADVDRIYAVIRGSAVNQDGRSNGLLAPNPAAQEAVLRAACRDAGVSPARVSYVETHGTGTLLGDSVEARALGVVMGAGRTSGPCAIGSVKTNIGHLEAAAGVVGLIKTALALHHHQLPASLHFRTPNPEIDFAGLGLAVQTGLAPWPSSDEPAVAGVSSFGFGGTNAHVVLEAPPGAPASACEPRTHLLCLSAHNTSALAARAAQLRDALAAPGASDPGALDALTYTANVRREALEHRLAVVGRSADELRARLDGLVRRQPTSGVVVGRAVAPRQVVFVFSGQGPKWWPLDPALLVERSAFTATLEACDDAAARFGAPGLLAWIRGATTGDPPADLALMQPIHLALQIALAASWRALGVTPAAVIGHSLGEVAAAHIAGALDLDTAMRVAVARGAALRQVAGRGKMAFVALPRARAEQALRGYETRLAIAASNAPAATILSGDAAALDEVLADLERAEVAGRMLEAVDFASHAPQVDGARAALTRELAGLTAGPTAIPMFSTVTGRAVVAGDLGAAYWGDNVRAPVLFMDAIAQASRASNPLFVEVSGHPTLLGAIAECRGVSSEDPAVAVPSLVRGEPGPERLLESLGTLHVLGGGVDLARRHRGGGAVVSLAPYPFQRSRFWFDAPAGDGWDVAARSQGHPLLGEPMALAAHPGSWVWPAALDRAHAPSYLDDHRVHEEAVLPAAALVEMALAAAARALPGAAVVEDLTWLALLPVANRQIQVTLAPDGAAATFRIHSRGDSSDGWRLHATARLRPRDGAGELAALAAARERCVAPIDPGGLYDQLAHAGLVYGPAFRGLVELRRGARQALGRIALPLAADATRGYLLHPALLDACFHVIAAALPAGTALAGVPARCERIVVHRPLGAAAWCHAVVRPPATTAGSEAITADLALFTEEGEPAVEIRGFELTPLGEPAPDATRKDWLYEVTWRVAEPVAPACAAGARGRWLIFADRGGVATRLARALERAGGLCLLIHDRPDGAPPDPSSVPGDDRDAIRRLIAEQLGSGALVFQGVVYLWALDAIEPGDVERRALVPLLYLVQALVDSGALTTPRLTLVTRAAQAVTGDEPIALAQAPLLGFAKTIAFEHPELSCTRVDLDPGDDLDAAAASLDAQLRQPSEDQIAIRGGTRYVPRLVARPEATWSPVAFRSDATYLITGGLGGLGLTVARWMVERGARNLALVGRSPPSARAQQVLAELRARGARVGVYQADVADPAQLARILTPLQGGGSALRGVIHAAGLLDDGALIDLDAERLRRVLLPKVSGAFHLDRLCEGLELELFVLFSSAVSVLGSPGQGNYSAGNAFLDALAHERRRRNLPALSVNWGPWADVGLAADLARSESLKGLAASRLVSLIPPERGLQLLEQLLGARATQVSVLPYDLKHLVQFYPAAAGMAFFSEVLGDDGRLLGQRGVGAVLHARPDLATAYVAPESPIERTLATMWRHALGIDRVGVHDTFFELGGDSVLASQLVMRANKAFDIQLSLKEAFQAFTIHAQAQLVETKLLAKLETMTEDEAAALLETTR
jgi:acyl transferase domain-containing protein/acyl carrier protein